MNKFLKITYTSGANSIDLFDGEVGNLNWRATQDGGITLSAEPPRPPGQSPASSGSGWQGLLKAATANRPSNGT